MTAEIQDCQEMPCLQIYPRAVHKPRPTRQGYCSYCWTVLKTAILCGDCLIPITDCHHAEEYKR